MTIRLRIQPLPHPQSGLTLVELLVAALLSAFLISGLVQIVSAASGSFRLQDNQAEVMENGRHAMTVLGKTIRQTGFTPQPWNPAFAIQGLMAATADDITSRSDRLVTRFWSDTNCFDNRNPVEDENGNAAFHIRESLFDLNSTNNLAHTCRYGPGESGMVTQINHQGFISNVESFQALYGEDSSGDGQVDRWVKARDWTATDRVLAVRIALLLSGTDPVTDAASQVFEVLDKEVTTTADGHLRQLYLFTTAIKGQSG